MRPRRFSLLELHIVRREAAGITAPFVTSAAVEHIRALNADETRRREWQARARAPAISRARHRRLESAAVRLSERRLQGSHADVPDVRPAATGVGDRSRGSGERLEPGADPKLQWLRLDVGGALRLAVQLLREGELGSA